MTTRAQFYANKRHDQRQFAEVKPVKVSQDESTVWIPNFIESLEGLSEKFHTGSIIAIQLGDTPELRERRLREMCRRRILNMSVLRDENDDFVRYEWEVAR